VTHGADRRSDGPPRAGWRAVALLSASLVCCTTTRAADPPPTFPGLPAPNAGDSTSLDSLEARSPQPGDSMRARPLTGKDSLAAPDGLAADSAAAPGWWRRLLGRPATWPAPPFLVPPDERPLPGLAERPDRPAEDLADELLPLTLGPLFDQAELGHRQHLAVDGLRPGAATLELDGLDLASRITGLADLNLLPPGLTRAARSHPWERLGERPAGRLAFTSNRAADDSVLTRVRWADGFMGLVTVEGEFQRPALGGRAWAASRQAFTHERRPGAHYRGNLFAWNWDRPLAEGAWLLQADQRLLRDKSEILGANGDERRLYQSLLRGRLTRRHGDLAATGLDIWQRRDDLAFTTGGLQEDRERLLGAALRHDRAWAGGGVGLALNLERQRLSSDAWRRRRTEAGLRAAAAWTLPLAAGRVALEPQGGMRHRTDDGRRAWDLGLRAGWTRAEGWADLLIARGQLPPTAEQLHLTRNPGLGDAVLSPWRREAGLPLVPNPGLDASRWWRQELRLGARLWRGRLPMTLRAFRVDLDEDPLETPASDSTWSWGGWDHTQWGLQLAGDLALAPGWHLRASQGWFLDSRELVSREFPSYLLDGALRHERRLFGGELALRVTAGLHHEYGAVDSRGDALWRRPELWLMGEAERKRFTLWWSLRNPFGLAENARVEGDLLHGHEEWLGLRWGFAD